MAAEAVKIIFQNCPLIFLLFKRRVEFPTVGDASARREKEKPIVNMMQKVL